jgi:hypothetical protein
MSILGAAANINDTYSSTVKIETPSLYVAQRNYAQVDMNQWTLIAAGSATNFRRSTTANKYRLNGIDVWEINSTAANTSDINGFQIDASLYPELNGKTFWFGMWVWCSDAACYAVPFSNAAGQDFNNNPTALGVWTFLAVSFVWPAAGTMSFGASKRGANLGSCYISAPMLCELGFPRNEATGLFVQNRNEWMGAAAPTLGTWVRSDRIRQLTATVGQPKGWSRTAAGTPGTWVSEGNL